MMRQAQLRSRYRLRPAKLPTKSTNRAACSTLTVASPAPQPQCLFRPRAFRLCKVPFPRSRSGLPGVMRICQIADLAERVCAEPLRCPCTSRCNCVLRIYIRYSAHSYGQTMFKYRGIGVPTHGSLFRGLGQIDHSTTLTAAVTLVPARFGGVDRNRRARGSKS